MAEQSVLIIGGGISGLTTALETAEAGYEVQIVERNPYLGGRVAQLNQYFPKLCPPVCGLEMNFRRLKENPRVTLHMMSEVGGISGEEGNFEVTINQSPRHVNDRCTGCDACAKACPAERPNDFNFGMDKTRAAYLPFNQAFPQQYVIDRAACQDGCGEPCREACKYDAIDLTEEAASLTIKVGAVVMATGWDLYDAKGIDILGGGKPENVLTNMMMERLASPSGPTGGKILRPSDGKEAKRVAFVQCAGSRDENHLAYCSYICCMASLKQATYLREQYPDSSAEVFYIDLRTPGRYEQFLWKIKEDENIKLTKGKVARITEDPETGDVTVEAEDVDSGRKVKETFDMVVLAAGMVPAGKDAPVPAVKTTGEGFVVPATLQAGIYAVGTAKGPVDVQRSVQDATAAALKSIQTMVRR